MLSVVALGLALPLNANDLFGPNDHERIVSKTENPTVFKIEYPYMTVFHDCTTKLPRMAIALVSQRDQKSIAQPSTVYFESQLPPACQPNTSIKVGQNFARFKSANKLSKHLPERLIPMAATSIVQGTTYVNDTHTYKTTNFFPSTIEMKYGPWYQYSQFVQCLRSQTKFVMVNGLIHNDKSNDLYVEHNAFSTPDFVWSALLLPNGDSFSFIFSNKDMPNRTITTDIRRYLVNLETLEKTLGFPIPMAETFNKKQVIGQLPNNKALVGCTGY